MKTTSLTHWGLFDFHVEQGQLINVTPHTGDTDPSPIGRNLINGNTKCRIEQPAIRRGFLEKDAGKQRGSDEFVSVSWEEAIDLAAYELDRVRTNYGNSAIYGGSYGWASAGRFHHAQSQLHRFLGSIGGYTGSVNAYSFAAAEVILPHVIGHYEKLLKMPSSWPTIIEHGELMVCFGGLPIRNSQITNGGLGRHVQVEYLTAARAAGIKFVNVSPARDDTPDFLDASWLAIRPGSDVALMLAIAHEIYIHDWHDQRFIDKYCVGFTEFVPYLTGEADGVPKTPAWAQAITGIPAKEISDLAKKMVVSRTMISVSWSLSRHEHGEQPYWMAIVLAAMLGQIGLPGAGIGLGYGVENKVGKNVTEKYFGHLPGIIHSVTDFIPVARIADMLISPGEEYSYNTRQYQYPDIKLVYWAGGNPFHHHQDLNRLRFAWQKPQTIICQELVWNATATHADIVLPVSSFLERNDIGGAPNEDILVAMKQVLEPFGDSRSDYAILSALAEKLNVSNIFTEGRSEMEWVELLYASTRKANPSLPEFDAFWEAGVHHFDSASEHTLFEAFRQDPTGNSLKTASGLIQISVPEIGHPTWHEPSEWLGSPGEHAFHLISHQPAARLHSQLDHGETSQLSKIDGLEPIRMNTNDAASLNLKTGDKVRVFNQRGAFYAGLLCTDAIRPGVLHIATGAWWDPDEHGACRKGNPNAVTQDIGTSELAQGPSALTCLVSIESIESIEKG